MDARLTKTLADPVVLDIVVTELFAANDLLLAKHAAEEAAKISDAVHGIVVEHACDDQGVVRVDPVGEAMRLGRKKLRRVVWAVCRD